MSPISVLIADDHALFRGGLGALLRRHKDIQVVGEATDGRQAISMVEALQPDILLLDVQMPELDGLEALLQVRKKSPRTKVLMIAKVLKDEFIIKALQLGAKGYVSKSLKHTALVKAIRATYAGEIWAERRILTQVLESLCRTVHGMNPSLSEIQQTLTAREREIVKWTIQGMTNKEIAARLGISDKTVKAHLNHVFGKLKISRRLQLTLHRIVRQPD